MPRHSVCAIRCRRRTAADETPEQCLDFSISLLKYLSVSLILTGRLGGRASNAPETGRWSSGGPAEETALVPGRARGLLGAAGDQEVSGSRMIASDGQRRPSRAMRSEERRVGKASR